MGEALPSRYDVIILGTGTPETILAAAVARIGKTVLHLDRNEYYGGDWTSFNFDNLLEWIEENQLSHHVTIPTEEFFPNENLLKEGEHFLTLPSHVSNISNVKAVSHIEETSEKVELATSGIESLSVAGDVSKEETEERKSSENEGGETAEADKSSDSSHEPLEGASSSNNTTSHAEPSPKQRLWTLEELKVQKRKFNLDLAPKLLFSRGPLVELLISSNISRYAEFKCTTRVLSYIDGQLVQVPCSRADVFSTKNVSVVEKRLLMKFLAFALEHQKHPDEYRGFEGRPFLEFLASKKLTKNVEHYLIHAIAMVDPDTPTLQSLKSVQKFLESLGRYGNSPFLWPLYGSAELPQCFCRLCAVFGGIYFLKRGVQAVVTSSEGMCTAVVSNGERLDCSWIIMESGYAPRSLLPQGNVGRISRGIFIANGSILHSNKEQLTLLRLPPDDKVKTTVTVLELGPSAYVCPDGLYVVYMSCTSSGATAEEDLTPASEILFNSSQLDSGDSNKPLLLWCVFYNQKDTSSLRLSENVQNNILLTSTPDLAQDYEHSVNEARQLFEKMFPNEPFLPRAPDPEEILIESESNNPGHSDTDASESVPCQEDEANSADSSDVQQEDARCKESSAQNVEANGADSEVCSGDTQD